MRSPWCGPWCVERAIDLEPRALVHLDTTQTIHRLERDRESIDTRATNLSILIFIRVGLLDAVVQLLKHYPNAIIRVMDIVRPEPVPELDSENPWGMLRRCCSLYSTTKTMRMMAMRMDDIFNG